MAHHLKFSFSILAVIVAAFTVIYLVEGYLEGRSVSAASVSLSALPQPLTAAWDARSQVHHGLCVAAMTGNTEQTRLLLDGGVSPNAMDSFGIRALARATLWGHHDVVELLLKRGGDVNERERLGVTLLMLAANQGDERLLRLFLSYGAEVNAQSEDGETALSTARKKGHHLIAEILVEAGAADLTPIAEQTLLSKRQAKKSAKASEPLPAGEPPAMPMEPEAAASLEALTWAADISTESVALIEEEMIREITARQEPPPAEDAAAGRTESVKTEEWSRELDELSAMIRELSEMSFQTQPVPEKRPSIKERPAASVEKKAVPQPDVPQAVAPAQKKTPLPLPPPAPKPQAQVPKPADHEFLHAVLLGDYEKVKTLINRGADVNARGALEMTPLMVAAQEGNLSVVKLLLDKRADVNARNIVGQTALRLAVLKERQDVINTLRKYGAGE